MGQAERAVRGGAEGRLRVSQWDAPVVEYRAWPIAWSPGMELSVASSKTWGDEAHVPVYVDALAVTGCDTCGFLAAVLKRVQAVVG